MWQGVADCVPVASAGKLKVKTDPWPVQLTTRIVPPCASTIIFAIGRPLPAPWTRYHLFFPLRIATECAMLLRSELQPPLGGRRRLSDWRLRLQVCGCWLVWHTTVRDRD